MNKDAKDQAQRICGEEEGDGLWADSDREGWTGTPCIVKGDQSLGTGGASGTGGLSVAGSAMGVRSRSLGGINSQLSTIKSAFLAYVHGHQERLEARLAESKAYEQQVLEQITSVEQQIAELLNQNEK